MELVEVHKKRKIENKKNTNKVDKFLAKSIREVEETSEKEEMILCGDYLNDRMLLTNTYQQLWALR